MVVMTNDHTAVLPSPRFETTPTASAAIVASVIFVVLVCACKWRWERNSTLFDVLPEPQCGPSDTYYQHSQPEVRRRRFQTRRLRVALLAVSFLSLLTTLAVLSAKRQFHVNLMLERLPEVSVALLGGEPRPRAAIAASRQPHAAAAPLRRPVAVVCLLVSACHDYRRHVSPLPRAPTHVQLRSPAPREHRFRTTIGRTGLRSGSSTSSMSSRA